MEISNKFQIFVPCKKIIMISVLKLFCINLQFAKYQNIRAAVLMKRNKVVNHLLLASSLLNTFKINDNKFVTRLSKS